MRQEFSSVKSPKKTPVALKSDEKLKGRSLFRLKDTFGGINWDEIVDTRDWNFDEITRQIDSTLDSVKERADIVVDNVHTYVD
jgi:hypothetical protein